MNILLLGDNTMKNKRVIIITILPVIILIGTFVIYLGGKPSVEMTPEVMPKEFSYTLPCDDNIEYVEPYGWVQVSDSGEYNTDFSIESSSNDQAAVEQIFSFLDLENRQFCGEIPEQDYYEYDYDDYGEDNKAAVHIAFDDFYYVTICPRGDIITHITHRTYRNGETKDEDVYYHYLSYGMVYQDIANFLRELYNQNNPLE